MRIWGTHLAEPAGGRLRRRQQRCAPVSQHDDTWFCINSLALVSCHPSGEPIATLLRLRPQQTSSSPLPPPPACRRWVKDKQKKGAHKGKGKNMMKKKRAVSSNHQDQHHNHRDAVMNPSQRPHSHPQSREGMNATNGIFAPQRAIIPARTGCHHCIPLHWMQNIPQERIGRPAPEQERKRPNSFHPIHALTSSLFYVACHFALHQSSKVQSGFGPSSEEPTPVYSLRS